MKANTNDIIFDSIKYLLLVFIVLVTLLPFVNILAVSLNDPWIRSRERSASGRACFH
jgi:ABC-type glycerol-3-phosphate transport system permease component